MIRWLNTIEDIFDSTYSELSLKVELVTISNTVKEPNTKLWTYLHEMMANVHWIRKTMFMLMRERIGEKKEDAQRELWWMNVQVVIRYRYRYASCQD